MDAETRRLRAASFESVAEAYERARPGYPLDAVRWLAGAPPQDVLDLGAGTGKLTRHLVAVGHRVTAVEPLPAMRAQLVAAVPGVVVLDGTAERIPRADATADVVTAAQAFHWFDHPVALPEIARVLRPGGVLALVWNMRGVEPTWMAELSAAMGGGESVGAHEADVLIAESGCFGPVERATFAHVQHVTGPELRDLVLSRSHCVTRPPDEREAVLAQVAALFSEHASDGVLELPYSTDCLRAVRR